MVGFSRSSFLVLASLLFSFELAAAPVVRPASAADVFVKGGQTLDINRHWGEILDVKPTPTSSSFSVRVPVVEKNGFGWGRIGTSIKNALKLNPVKFAATAGVMYLIDQIPGADVIDGTLVRTPDFQSSGSYWAASVANSSAVPTRHGTYSAACYQLIGTPAQAWHWSGSWTQLSPTAYQCHRVYSSLYCPSCGTVYMGRADKITVNCPNGFDSASNTCRTSPIQPQPFTDADFDQLASHAPDIPESIWNDGFGTDLGSIPGTFDNPDAVDFTGPESIDLPSTTTTSTNPTTGDTTVTESLPSVRLDYGTNPLSITPTPTTTTNTYTNGNLTNTTNTTTNSNVTSPIVEKPEIPTDCDFMPTVCGFIDWVKEPFDPEEIDLAEYIEDEDFTKEVTFSGNATCPPPTTITTAFGDQVFDWTPGCDWAAMLKPLVVLGALLAALYISLGLGRSD